MAKSDVKEELFSNEEEVVEEIVPALPNEPLIHTMVRTIKMNPLSATAGKTIQQVDEDTSQWRANGYRLVNAQYVGTDADTVLCIYFFEKVFA